MEAIPTQETPIGIQGPSGHAKAREAAYDLRTSVLQQQEINLQPRGAGKMQGRRLWPSRGHYSLHLIPDSGTGQRKVRACSKLLHLWYLLCVTELIQRWDVF